jgi:hypothetical protein
MKCDSRASFLACTFASPYFGREPKAKIVAKIIFVIILSNIHIRICENIFLTITQDGVK